MNDVAVHPDARWCLDKEMEFASEGGIRGDGSSISSIEPKTVSDSGLVMVMAGEFDQKYDVAHSLLYIHNHDLKLAAERAAKKKQTAEDRATAKLKKAQDKKKNPAPKKTRKTPPKTKCKPTEEEDGLPPVGHRISYHWPSGAAKGWYDCTYKGSQENEDGELECVLEDKDGAVNMYGVELMDLDWHLLRFCPHCKLDTKGPRVCGRCKEFRDSDDDGNDSDDEDF
jgi:hypothetical protein